MQRAGRKLDKAPRLQRCVAESAIKIMQFDRAHTRKHELSLIGHGVHMCATALQTIRSGPLIVDRQVSEADPRDETRLHRVLTVWSV